MNKNNKLKILYLITQSELGGAQRYILDLTKALQEEYKIIVAFGEQGHEGELAKQLKATNAIYYHIPHLKRAISPLNDLKALWEIIKLIRRLKPDIVHLNSSKISILGSIAVRIIRGYSFINSWPIRVVYTVHGWVFNEPLPPRKKKFYLRAEKFTARFKHKLICVSEFDYQLALKEKIAPPEKLTTIRNGIKPINFLSSNDAKYKFDQIVNRQSKIDNRKSTILSIGNLYPTKGYEYLVRAVKILVDNNYQIQAFIIGAGPEEQELKNIIGQLGLKNNVILAGRIDNAAQLLKAGQIYVCSSVKEGLSYTIIEAMQAGLPIVAASVGGNPELITDQEQGMLMPAQNPEALANAIVKLIDDPNLAQRLGQAAQQKAFSDFSLARMIIKTKSVYTELLNK